MKWEHWALCGLITLCLLMGFTLYIDTQPRPAPVVTHSVAVAEPKERPWRDLFDSINHAMRAVDPAADLVNIGSHANDSTGDPIPVALGKIDKELQRIGLRTVTIMSASGECGEGYGNWKCGEIRTCFGVNGGPDCRSAMVHVVDWSKPQCWDNFCSWEIRRPDGGVDFVRCHYDSCQASPMPKAKPQQKFIITKEDK